MKIEVDVDATANSVNTNLRPVSGVAEAIHTSNSRSVRL